MNAALQLITQRIDEYISDNEFSFASEPMWLQYFTKKLMVKDGNVMRILPLTGIVFMQSQSNYTLIVTETKKYLISKTLKHFETAGLHPYFIRVHNSYIINKMMIDSMSKSDNTLNMINGVRIPVSRNFKSYNEIYSLNSADEIRLGQSKTRYCNQ